MKKLAYLMGFALFLCACGQQASKKGETSAVKVEAFYQGDEENRPQDQTLHLQVRGVNGEKIILNVNGKDQVYDVPEDGKLDIQLKQIIPQYSSIIYGEKSFPLYLGGGEAMQVVVPGGADDWVIEYSGGNQEINKYLRSRILPLGTQPFYYDEKRLAEETEKILQQNLDNLKKSGLSGKFAEMEAERLKYSIYREWVRYAFNHRWMAGVENFEPNDSYYNKLEELAQENPDVIYLEAYRRFLENAIPVITSRGLKDASPKELTTKNAEYVLSHYEHSLLRRYLLDYFISGYIQEHGAAGAEELVAIYKQNIADSSRLEQFGEIIENWEKIDKGDVSPSFNYADAKGNSVNLESFRGKYVLIDIWASWCGPCRREIPALKALEKKFEGKPIVFVSISCDKDPEAWKTAMKEENTEGIQLIAGADLSFLKAYMVQAIPRFILLDPEGKIVDAHMTLPSDPATEQTLVNLLGQ